ncbi:MAG: hypothetical protein U5O39_15125 [Gammaproteobacteria bacterium]|nr:hypothetical protein [Gammaproteobacteria bacterium]
MGLLIDGQWHDQWYDTDSTGGRFERVESPFRDRVTADGSSGFKAEPGRYHLYVSLACPWASRALIFRKLKRLEDVIDVSVVHWHMGENDWRLFTTLIRFDPVYHGHFKCNKRRLMDYQALWTYTFGLYHTPGIKDTIDFSHIKRHYYGSHNTINPTGVVPKGPDLNLDKPGTRPDTRSQ